MKHQKESGLYAGPVPEKRAGLGGLLSRFVLSGLVSLSLAALLTTGCGLERLPEALAALLAACVAACGLLTAAGQWRRARLLPQLALAALLLLCLLCREPLRNGFGLLWNGARELWAEAAGVLLPMTAAQGHSGLWLAGGLLGCLLAAAGYGLSVFAPSLCAGLLMLLTAAAAAFRPEVWLLLPAAAAVLLLAAYGGLGRRSLVSLLTCGGLALLLCAGVVLLAPAGAVRTLAEGGMEALHRWRYEPEGALLPEGDLSRPVPAHSGDAVILQVTAETAQTLYLRGFVGDTFENDRWTPLEGKAAAEAKDLFYWLDQAGFYPQSQLALAARQMGEAEAGTVQLENLAGCSLYRYLPCTVLPETAGLDGGTLRPSSVTNSGWRGARRDTFRTLTDMQSLLPELLTFLQTDRSEQTAAYLQAESAYRAFVRSYGLAVPASIKGQMGELLERCCARYGGAEGLTDEEAQICALAFLEACFDGEEGVSLPLEDTAAGTSYQYATVAALALRYYGIPTRYAEGYTVSAGAGAVTTVTAACAGAWVEVYQDGVGWLPLELTPGFEGLSGQQTADGVKPVGAGAQGEGDGLRIDEGQTPPEEQEPQDEPTQEDNPSGGQRTGLLKSPALWLLLLLAVLLLAAAVLALRRRHILRKRQEGFTQADRAAACGCLFADAAALLEPLGLSRGRSSMLALCGPAGERLGADYGEELREMAMLNAQALFSSRTPEEEQLERMTRFHARTRQALLTNSKILKKWQLKWLKCLF